MRKIFMFILFLLPWFLSTVLFKPDSSYYYSLKLPFFAPPSIIFTIVWIIIYILIAYNTFKIYDEYKCECSAKKYYSMLIINYVFNQLFIILFFCFHSLFLGFVDTLAVFITSLWVYYESNKLNDEVSKPLVPYIIWALFATLLSLTVYLMNF